MKHIEHNIQVGIHRILTAYNILHFAVPNGGHRSITTATFLKAEGVMAGVADLIILLPNRAIFVEVKTDNGSQQKTQKDFQHKVEALGFDYLIWRSLDECIKWCETNQKII